MWAPALSGGAASGLASSISLRQGGMACSAPGHAQRAGRSQGALPRRVAARASAAAGPSMSFHIGETTVSFPLDRASGQELAEAISGVMATFADKAKAERPKRWPAMEFACTGGAGSELGGGLQKLEVYCNPNAHPTAFDAKVLISLQTREGVAVTTEGKLSAVRADVEAFIEAAAK